MIENTKSLSKLNISNNGEKKSIEVSPTFLLKAIDPLVILESYLKGEYNTKTIPNIKITISDKIITSDHVIGNDQESEIYEYIDKNNMPKRIITSNHKSYAIVRDKLSINNFISDGIICQNCRRIFYHKPLGTVLAMEYIPLQNFKKFHVEGILCTYQCCFSKVKQRSHSSFNLKNPLYRDSETLLRILFELEYPGEKLKECGDWTLLECNGGPVSEKDFFNKYHTYQQTPNIVLLPAKIEYSLDILPNPNIKK